MQNRKLDTQADTKQVAEATDELAGMEYYAVAEKLKKMVISFEIGKPYSIAQTSTLYNLVNDFLQKQYEWDQSHRTFVHLYKPEFDDLHLQTLKSLYYLMKDPIKNQNQFVKLDELLKKYDPIVFEHDIKNKLKEYVIGILSIGICIGAAILTPATGGVSLTAFMVMPWYIHRLERLQSEHAAGESLYSLISTVHSYEHYVKEDAMATVSNKGLFATKNVVDLPIKQETESMSLKEPESSRAFSKCG